ncbi:MAG: hypothetical protein ACRD3S_10070 [Terracidiphilus sp.]
MADKTVSTQPAAAQGPAGAGAAEAAQESSHGSRSLNPLNWVKKDSKSSAGASGNREDIEKKLTPTLRAQGLLAAGASVTDSCATFVALDGCLAALHASHDLKIDFACLRGSVTGVNTSADVSGCTVADGDKAQSLEKALRQLKPDANARQAAKDAEQEAKDDLTGIGG